MSANAGDATYKVVFEKDGCAECGAETYWTIEQPDGICLGQSWADEGHTNEVCEMLNRAYSAGQEAKSPPVAVAAEGLPEEPEIVKVLRGSLCDAELVTVDYIDALRTRASETIAAKDAEIARLKNELQSYEFAKEGDEFDERGVSCIDLGQHYADAVMALTERKAYSKSSCAQLIAEQAKRAESLSAKLADAEKTFRCEFSEHVLTKAIKKRLEAKLTERDGRPFASTGFPLLWNVWCMSAQEKDDEWQDQWRQLMQAVELELTAAGYKPSAEQDANETPPQPDAASGEGGV